MNPYFPQISASKLLIKNQLLIQYYKTLYSNTQVYRYTEMTTECVDQSAKCSKMTDALNLK